MSRVLVTGGSGYLATRLIADLLLRETEVRATVRTAHAEAGVREAVRRAGADATGLELFLANLTDDEGWAEATSGVDGIYHLASPMIQSDHPDEVLVPARDGTLRVLRAAHEAAVRRVVMTEGVPQAPAFRPGVKGRAARRAA